VAHHRSMEAAPFSAISIIGIRLEPRIGAASSISVAPNGNESSAEAHGSETATTSNASNARQQLMIIGSPKTRRGTHEGCWSEQTLGLDRHGGLRECAWPGQARPCTMVAYPVARLRHYFGSSAIPGKKK